MKAWGDTLPTASAADADQTKIEVGTNRKAYFAVCGELDLCEGAR